MDGAEYKKLKNLTYVGGDFLLKQTVCPEPGMAVKEVFFTVQEMEAGTVENRKARGRKRLRVTRLAIGSLKRSATVVINVRGRFASSVSFETPWCSGNT